MSAEGCRSIFTKSVHRSLANKIMSSAPYIDYNLFGTVTGRLTTYTNSFPVLTMHRELRQLIKPHNDWFLSMDYNGAELRTVLALSGHTQPEYDVHKWNMENVFTDHSLMERSTAKTLFFSWLYNSESSALDENVYKRDDIVSRYYNGEYVTTPFERHIKVDNRRAFNYIIQSTTADLVIDRASKIDDFLKDYKSFVSHIVHDEIVIDLAEDEKGDSVSALTDGAEESDIKGAELDETELNEPEIAGTEIEELESAPNELMSFVTFKFHPTPGFKLVKVTLA